MVQRVGVIVAFVVGTTLGVLAMTSVEGAAPTDLVVPAVSQELEEAADADVEVIGAGEAGEVVLVPGSIDFASPPRPTPGWTVTVDSRNGPWRRAVAFTSPGREIRVVGIQERSGRVIDVCEVTSPPDGRLQVGDAGHLVARADGFRLGLGEPEPANGWRMRVEERDIDELESVWLRDGRSYRLEVEAENGAIEVELCERLEGPPAAD